MKISPDINGVGIHWGVTSTGLTGFGSLTITDTDQGLEADTATAEGADGYTLTHVTFNHRETANLTTWVSGSAGISNATIAASTVPAPGDKITITDSVNTLISGSNWIVGNSSVKRANKDLARVSTSLTRLAKIS